LIGRTGTPVHFFAFGTETKAAGSAPCDFWDQFFLTSVAAAVPASEP
jgi:hypothetical protein